MACYKLSSCTNGDTTVIYSNEPSLSLLVGGTTAILPYTIAGGYPLDVCFTVEEVFEPCACGPIDPFTAAAILGPCDCDNLDLCYTLTDCNNPIITYDTLTNLNPYVGQTISVAEYSGCFVVSSKPIIECVEAAPVTCVQSCVCPTCYSLQNCQILGAIFPISTVTPLVPGDVIGLLPGEIPIPFQGYPNCWTVLPETPCTGGETVITTVSTYADCDACLGSFYTLTPCETDGTTYCTFTNLSLFVGQTINVPGLVGCFTVSVGVGTCLSPIVVPVGSVTPCVCPHCYLIENCFNSSVVFTVSSLSYPGFNSVISITSVFPIPPGLPNCWTVKNEVPCLIATPTITYNSEIDCPTCISDPAPECYKLTSCDGLTVIYTNTDLSIYVGGSNISIPGYNGACFTVTLALRGECLNPITVGTPTTCVCQCYQLVDCITDQPYITLFSPTLNGVDLSLLVGQVVGTVCLDGALTQCSNGCWRVEEAPGCSAAVTRAVTNIKQDCDACLQVCYALTDCDTQQVLYTISYTTPNILLPNPATLVGQTLGNICFKPQYGGCIDGCYYLQLIGPNSNCANAINWTDVVSFTTFPSCISCKSSCYLLEPCDQNLNSIIVNNNLQLYLNQVINVCITGPNGTPSCACYTVRTSQTCTGAISIPNPTSTLDSCDSCTYCYCPPGYQKVGDSCQKIINSPATQNDTLYNVGAGATNVTYGSLGTNFYPNISSLPYPISESGGQFVDAGLNTVAPVVNINTPGSVWSGPTGSRLNTVGVWTTLPAGAPLNEWIGFTHCINVPTTKTYCIGIAADNKIRFKIDGILVLQAANYVVFNFNYWHVFKLH